VQRREGGRAPLGGAPLARRFMRRRGGRLFGALGGGALGALELAGGRLRGELRLALGLLLRDELRLEGPRGRDARVLLLPARLADAPPSIAPLLAVVLADLALDLVLVVQRRPLRLARLEHLAGIDHG